MSRCTLQHFDDLRLALGFLKGFLLIFFYLTKFLLFSTGTYTRFDTHSVERGLRLPGPFSSSSCVTGGVGKERELVPGPRVFGEKEMMSILTISKQNGRLSSFKRRVEICLSDYSLVWE
jgi:hypothetical protein